ncbi:hypothetical protein, partial [Streptomyces sp. CT34]|uniref:hypothetical protein n=1 Tax=Streptomyces sp. CT34 TaxID=1553907 RepID=UPI0019D7089E
MRTIAAVPPPRRPGDALLVRPRTCPVARVVAGLSSARCRGRTGGRASSVSAIPGRRPSAVSQRSAGRPGPSAASASPYRRGA